MLARRSIVPCSSTSPCGVSTWRSFQVSSTNPSCFLATFKHANKCQFLGNQRLQIFSSSLELHQASKPKMNMAVNSGVEPGPPLPSNPFPVPWKSWILGIILSVILPLSRNKLSPILLLKAKVESVVETAELVADVVEKVAEEVEKVADEVGDHLPEDGNLKKAVTLVEKAAKEVDKAAELAGDIIDKVEEVEKEVESFIEPVIDQTNGTNKEAKA